MEMNSISKEMAIWGKLIVTRVTGKTILMYLTCKEFL